MINVSKDTKNFNPSEISSTDSDEFKLIEKTIHEIIPDTSIIPTVCIGATDSRYFLNLSNNIYRYSPIILNESELKIFHGINEKISITNYERLIRFYSRLIENSGDN